MNQEIQNEENSGEVAVPKIHLCSKLLIAKLRNGKPGDVRTDAELSKIIGMDTRPRPGNRGYGYLSTAIRHCLNLGVYWERIRNAEMIKCLMPGEINDSVDNDMLSIRKRSGKAVKKLGSMIERDQLGEQEKNQALVRIAHFDLFKHLASKPMQNKMLEHNLTDLPSAQKMLESLKKSL